jgi:hypothetical protein
VVSEEAQVMMTRDDRVLPETRALAMFIVPFLLVAFPLLYFFANDTGDWWAWEIRPSMTAFIMGAGYIAGAYFFWQVARATCWHRVHLGFLPITAFTAFLGVATVIYWDWFDHDHVAFWIWTGLYFATPFLVPLAWLRNRRTDPGTLEAAVDSYFAATGAVDPDCGRGRGVRDRRRAHRVAVDDGRHLAVADR